MKKYILFYFLLSGVLFAQSIRTESASNRQISYSSSGVDTLLSEDVGYLVSVVFNTCVASDSIYLKQGSDTLAKIVFTASPPVQPFVVDYSCRVDSIFSVIRKKSSDFTVIYRPTPFPNTAPTIEDISNQSTLEDIAKIVYFSVTDNNAVSALTMSGTSSNTTLLPNANITFSGNANYRSTTLTPALNRTGTATVTLIVSDAQGLTASDAFVLTVTSVNDAPTITNIPDTSTALNTPTPAIAFTIGDAETPAAALSLDKSSSNTTLVPTANIVFAGSGASRTVTITPATGESGQATITITVSDGVNNTSDDFVLTVNP